MKLRSMAQGFALAVLLTGCTASNPLEKHPPEKVAEFIWGIIQAKREQGRAIFEKLDVATIDELKEELETDVFVPDDFWANIWKEDIADINLHIMYTQFRWHF